MISPKPWVRLPQPPSIPGQCKKTVLLVEVLSDRSIPVENCDVHDLAAHVWLGGASISIKSLAIAPLTNLQTAEYLDERDEDASLLLGEDWEGWTLGSPEPQSEECNEKCLQHAPM